MSAALASRWAAVATAAVALLLPRPGSGTINPNPPNSPTQPTWGCPQAVDGSDPLAVASAAAAWVFCGPPPDAGDLLSWRGRQALGRWSSVIVRRVPVTILTAGLLDPRAAPVVAYVVVVRSGDVDPHRLVATLFRRPNGRWAVDDLARLDG